MVPTANNEIEFEVQGTGKLIGVDNGDPLSHEDYKASHRRAFNGLCLAIVQATDKAGRINIVASSPTLRSDSLTIVASA
jgi:beta-galactosidase